jgi:putative transposase
MSSIAGLTIIGQIYTKHFDGSIDSDGAIAMLKHMLRQMPDGYVLVWDGASIHRRKTTRAFLRQHREIAVEQLPPYAPELNPEEYCHGNIKPHNQKRTRLTSSNRFTSAFADSDADQTYYMHSSVRLA